MSPVVTLVASTVSVFLGNGILLACVLGCVVLAWRQGFFYVTLVGMGFLVALLLALTGAGELARVLIESDLPPRHAPFLAYAAIFAGGLIAVGMALSQWVPEQAVWNGSLLGRLIGVGAGLVAGVLLAGGILIGWSMVGVPRTFALQPNLLLVDVGQYAIKAAARFIEPDRERREMILGGSERFRSVKPAFRPRCSEPFVDSDQNCVRGENEWYYDIDGDGLFTLEMPAPGGGVGGPERWIPGMLDCYLMGSWLDVRAAHAPRLTSPAEVEVDVGAIGGGLYQSTAADPDECDQLKYGLKQTEADLDPPVTINPDTGRVDLTEAAVQEVQREYEFTITVTDLSGLAAELPVHVRILNLPPDPKGS